MLGSGGRGRPVDRRRLANTASHPGATGIGASPGATGASHAATVHLDRGGAVRSQNEGGGRRKVDVSRGRGRPRGLDPIGQASCRMGNRDKETTIIVLY